VHELGLCEAIVDAAEARAGGRRVRSLTVTVGGAHAADEAALRQSMAMVAVGTVVEGAELEIRLDPVRVRCTSCGAESTGTEGIGTAVCPRCHGVDVQLVGGGATVLERLDLEDAPSSPATVAAPDPFATVPVTERSDHAH
jgi:hydrogenase nickel incorporation protein HypA/HybF